MLLSSQYTDRTHTPLPDVHQSAQGTAKSLRLIKTPVVPRSNHQNNTEAVTMYEFWYLKWLCPCTRGASCPLFVDNRVVYSTASSGPPLRHELWSPIVTRTTTRDGRKRSHGRRAHASKTCPSYQKYLDPDEEPEIAPGLCNTCCRECGDRQHRSTRRR